MPWHAHRWPVAELAGALDAAAAVAAKIGLDVVQLAQTEVGEVSEAPGGVSTAMAHKHNPMRAVRARACARLAHANAGVLTGGDYEHERAAGHWHAEWSALSDLLALSGGAANAARECLEGLHVNTARMRANISSDLDARDLGSAEAFVDRALALYGETA